MTTPKTETTEAQFDLSLFCASEQFGRTNLTTPFSRGNWTYATDGKVMVRIPRRADIPERGDAPHVERIWPKEVPLQFVPVVPTRLPEREYVQCDMCDGRGSRHDCPDCQCRCEECQGEGLLEEAVAIGVGPELVTRRVAELLMALPDAEIAPMAGAVMQFRFRGGDGIFTTLKPHTDRPVIGRITAEEADDAR